LCRSRRWHHAVPAAARMKLVAPALLRLLRLLGSLRLRLALTGVLLIAVSVGVTTALVLGDAGQRRAVFIAGAVALAGGAVLLLATFVMLAPLRRLEQRARRLLDDDLADDEGWPQSQGEIGHLSSVLQQVMRQRARAAASNRELVDAMRAVMAHAPVGIAITRGERFDLVSDSFNRLLGHAERSLEGEATRRPHASDEAHETLTARISAAFGVREPFDEEVELVRHDGSRFWARLRGTPVRWGEPLAGTLWMLEDVSQARSQREALWWTSSHDTLTELINRREFERLLQGHVGSRRRETVCVLHINLDNFKAVNHGAGHGAGDRLLVQVARLLVNQVRGSDTVARLDGDEFGVLLPGCERDDAVQLAGKLCSAVEALRLPWGDQTLGVGASIGVVQLQPALPDLASVMSAAAAACREAKRAGNGVRIYGAPVLRLVASGQGGGNAS